MKRYGFVERKGRMTFEELDVQAIVVGEPLVTVADHEAAVESAMESERKKVERLLVASCKVLTKYDAIPTDTLMPNIETVRAFHAIEQDLAAALKELE